VVLLTAVGPSGGDDASLLAPHREDDDVDAILDHADEAQPDFSLVNPMVRVDQVVRISEGFRSEVEREAALASASSVLHLVPFEIGQLGGAWRESVRS
jgi:hypothetical protein